MPQPGLKGQEINRFLGVNLRQDRTDLGDDELAKAINCDLNTQIGTIVVRPGKTKQFSSALSDTSIRLLAKINGHRYEVAGRSVYRDQTVIINGLLSANLKTSITPFRPVGDSNTWAFIADESGMWKDNGTTLQGWGIAPPGTEPSVTTSAGSLRGDYLVKYTFARVESGNIVTESAPSPPSNLINGTNILIAVSNLDTSSDAQVTHLRLYRTVSGGATYLFDTQIVNGTSTVNLSKDDNQLGAELASDNDMPPHASWVRVFNETAFLCGDPTYPHFLYISERFNPEVVTDYIEIGNADDPLLCAIPIAGVIGVFTRTTKYRVTGNATAGYVSFEHLSRRGSPSPYAVVPTENGIIFPAKDGVYTTNLIAPDVSIGDAILPIFFWRNGQ